MRAEQAPEPAAGVAPSAGPALIGALAPDFSLPAAGGGRVTLAEKRGGPVVLVFFRGTW